MTQNNLHLHAVHTKIGNTLQSDLWVTVQQVRRRMQILLLSLHLQADCLLLGDTSGPEASRQELGPWRSSLLKDVEGLSAR